MPKKWAVPKVWVVSLLCCDMGYASLLFLSNMLLGLIIASVFIGLAVLCDSYIHYR
jgi:hypothetical protein